MGKEGFYESADSATILDKYQKLKNELSATYETWETLQIELESLSV